MNHDPLFASITDIRAAATTISGGLLDHQVVSPEQWDDAVVTLARAHDQIGGPARRHLYELFAAASVDPVHISRPLAALLENLGASRHSVSVDEQLSLFDPDPDHLVTDDEVCTDG